MRRWLFLFALSACSKEVTAEWSPECQRLFQQTEEACASVQNIHPPTCEGAREGKKRLEARGAGEYDEECRAARESLERELNALLKKTEE